MTNAQALLFLAVLVQVVLTLILYALLLRSRIRTAKAGEADMSRIAYDVSGWPLQPRLYANAVSSQFELPVLFYVAVVLAMILGGVDWITVILAWLFVLARIVHAVIHTGKNAIMPRLGAFGFSFAMIVLIWAWLTLHVAGATLALS